MNGAFADLLAANARYATDFQLAGFDGVPHTRCAVATATESQLRERISEASGQDASEETMGAVEDQVAALRDDVARVRAHPLVAASVAVGGLLYDVDTGRLSQLV